MADSTRILFKQDTVLKQEPIQSSQLPSNKLQDISVGTILILDTYEAPTSKHIRISLKNLEIKGLKMNWYAYEDHVTILKDAAKPVETVDSKLAKQQDKSFFKFNTNSSIVSTQNSLLKLVFNVDTVIKRTPTESSLLEEKAKQDIPAGTELIILADKPNANKEINFSIEKSHIKFTLKDIEFKGFKQNWYAFVKHVGVQLIG
ncbi:MAG: hypothetical protein WA919_14725 [Coleofasciculaceae cyanobacterium]